MRICIILPDSEDVARKTLKRLCPGCELKPLSEFKYRYAKIVIDGEEVVET